jgi:hypothetical protein
MAGHCLTAVTICTAGQSAVIQGYIGPGSCGMAIQTWAGVVVGWQLVALFAQVQAGVAKLSLTPIGDIVAIAALSIVMPGWFGVTRLAVGQIGVVKGEQIPTAHTQVAVVARVGSGTGSAGRNLKGGHLRVCLQSLMVGRHIFGMARCASAGIWMMNKLLGLPAIGSGVAGDTYAGVMLGRTVSAMARLALLNPNMVKAVRSP